ncbi:TPA: hypothetical protein OLX96_002605 [Clostridioides difficile]|jgi:hypothetical protein|nr:hypothetical protein [Clostridioides difficile]HCQ6314250.1 hypothetical protein [Clostridioides difficile]
MFSKKVNDNNSKLNKDKAVKVKKSGKERALLIVKTVAIPLVFAAVVVVALYLAMQSKFEADSLKGDVLVMKEQVSANTKVTKADADKYFSKVSVELTAIPSTAYKSVNELPDAFYIEDAMAKNQMVVKANIATADPVMDKYRNGYELTSFAAQSYDFSVNGSLRHGDIVDVYAVNPATETLELMAENVYVDQVYDNSGNKITDDEGVATSFTVWVTSDEVQQINTAVVYGGIQMYLKTE